jgi:hypothetical protein
MHMMRKPGGTAVDWDLTASASNAPGVSDNASGVAAVLELARVLSAKKLSKTVVFIAFGAEEQGLVGASAYAKRSAGEKQKIEAVFNVDTIGTNVTGSGMQAGQRVSVYSDEPMDGPSRTLARYVKEAAERWFPELHMNLVFRADRFGRGGDHTAFHREGFAAVRFTTPAEQLENQHNEKDTLDRVSVPYVTLVTRGIGTALASLALAPMAPVTQPLGRGPGMYDAVMRWKPGDGPEPAGYAVVVRSTTAPFWERVIPVGKATEHTMKNVSIDEWVFGVRALGEDGVESLTSPWQLRRNPFTAGSAASAPATAN